MSCVNYIIEKKLCIILIIFLILKMACFGTFFFGISLVSLKRFGTFLEGNAKNWGDIVISVNS